MKLALNLYSLHEPELQSQSEVKVKIFLFKNTAHCWNHRRNITSCRNLCDVIVYPWPNLNTWYNAWINNNYSINAWLCLFHNPSVWLFLTKLSALQHKVLICLVTCCFEKHSRNWGNPATTNMLTLRWKRTSSSDYKPLELVPICGGRGKYFANAVEISGVSSAEYNQATTYFAPKNE